jgi:peptide/nickel transport system substrate-binding protein
MSPKRTILVLLASASLAVTALPAAAAASPTVPAAYPRSETMYTSGTMYGQPGDFNPLNTGDYTTGTLGLLYEPLFVYNPLTNKFIPWLAQSGSWTGAKEYTLTLRQGLKWNDGTALTADDVVYTVNLGKLASSPYSSLWNFLSSVTKVNPTTVKFTFSKPEYQEWSNWLYNYGILPANVWGTQTATTLLTYNVYTSTPSAGVVGSGPYELLTFDTQKVVWVRDDSWWGTTVLGLTMKPKYIIDEVNASNNVELGQMLAGNLDLSNNFLPGIGQIVSNKVGGYPISTYYAKAPYMLSANTAWLATNDVKTPTNDPVFRRALAMSINVSQIVNNVYGNIVAAANPTGLLPSWSQYINQSLVKQYGFTYNPGGAKALLKSAGYKLGTDGYFRNKNGSVINLQLQVPSGWTDWMAAIQSIAKSAKAGGIRITPVYPSYNDYQNKLQNGTFQLAIVNNAQLSNTPWTYYNFMFNQPIQKVQSSNYNFGRYSNKQIWALTQQLDTTPSTNVTAMKSIISQIQKIQLQDTPIIPLWYNGVWAQAYNGVWTNWPTSASGSPHYVPCTWRGYWNLGAVLMLTTLKPVS